MPIAVPSSDYDFGGCELYPNYATTSHGNTVVGSHCDGSANSNLFDAANRSAGRQ